MNLDNLRPLNDFVTLISKALTSAPGEYISTSDRGTMQEILGRARVKLVRAQVEFDKRQAMCQGQSLDQGQPDLKND